MVSDNHGDDDDAVNQDDTLALRFIEKSNWDMAGENPFVNSQQKTD